LEPEEVDNGGAIPDSVTDEEVVDIDDITAKVQSSFTASSPGDRCRFPSAGVLYLRTLSISDPSLLVTEMRATVDGVLPGNMTISTKWSRP